MAHFTTLSDAKQRFSNSFQGQHQDIPIKYIWIINKSGNTIFKQKFADIDAEEEELYFGIVASIMRISKIYFSQEDTKNNLKMFRLNNTNLFYQMVTYIGHIIALNTNISIKFNDVKDLIEKIVEIFKSLYIENPNLTLFSNELTKLFSCIMLPS